jgi:predicted choloylglycine hydrolase
MVRALTELTGTATNVSTAMWSADEHELELLPVRGEDADDSAPAPDCLTFEALSEPEPGATWQASFQAMWPAYRRWYLKEGDASRPDLDTCRAMLDHWMPELAPTFERLVELAGGDPLAARFLSMYRPPGFVVGCSQAAFTGDGAPVLVRNYDYPASRAEGIIISTAWTGRRVIGMSDCLWGLLDGVNDAGLAASLTFGGRPVVGDGFGIPVVMRYVLEVCETVSEACRVFARIPVHAAQNVTVLDRSGDFATIRLSPDRDPEVLTVPVATNHQHQGDWPAYAAAVQTHERERRLLELLRTPQMTRERLIEAFLSAPLYRLARDRGGTLYTAVYDPVAGTADYRWPEARIAESLAAFTHATHVQCYATADSGDGNPPQLVTSDP